MLKVLAGLNIIIIVIFGFISNENTSISSIVICYHCYIVSNVLGTATFITNTISTISSICDNKYYLLSKEHQPCKVCTKTKDHMLR